MIFVFSKANKWTAQKVGQKIMEVLGIEQTSDGFHDLFIEIWRLLSYIKLVLEEV
jgi:hypothetical protein